LRTEIELHFVLDIAIKPEHFPHQIHVSRHFVWAKSSILSHADTLSHTLSWVTLSLSTEPHSRAIT